MQRCFAFALVALMACEGAPPEPNPGRPAPPPADSTARAPSVTPTVRFLRAGEGELSAIVRRERETAAKEGRTLLVYVGAPWCEPCTRFHQAAEAGQLEGKLPPLLLLELDRDVDETRLGEAGYLSRLIPLFAAPAEDGRSGPHRMEGSIKGAGAVDEILPRLKALVGQAKGP